MDHFWIIRGPFWTILLTVLSTLCQWSCGLVDHFLKVKWLEQVNLHFWIIFYNTHCGFNMLLIWKLCFWIIFVNMNWWIISFLELTLFESYFFRTNWWIIFFLELSETKMIQKCKFQKRKDPPICVEKV